MKINIYLLKHLLEDILIKKGIVKKDAIFIANDYWAAEISGKLTHGIIKFYKELPYYKDRRGNPQIIIDKGPIVLVDANREIGQLSAKFCIDLLKKRTKKYGIAIVGMKNSQRYGVLSTWVKILAESDLVGIAINSSEPATTVYGGSSPILGTNPIAIAIPTHNKKPILIDMATSKSPMGSLLYSTIYNKPLSNKTFINKKGRYTTKPNEVYAVENFGGYKGYALSLALEVLSGSLLSAKMGGEIKSHYDVGYFFQAIDPGVFQEKNKFKNQNEALIKEIKSSKVKKGSKVYIPGEQSEKSKRQNIKAGNIDISREIYEKLLREK